MKILSSLSGAHSRLWAYPLAIGLVLLTLWLRLLTNSQFGGPALIVFTVPIMLAAYWGGLWAGLLATGAAVLGANYYLLPPIHDFAVASPYERFQEGIMVTVGMVTSIICEALHRARRRADMARAAAESGLIATARLAAIVASSEDAVVGKDLNGTITSWNDASERIFGYNAGEMIGSPITLLIPPELVTEEEQIIGQLKAGQTVAHFETRRLTKSGAEIMVSLSVSPIRNGNGRVVGAAKIVRDITEKRGAESRLQALQSELAHVARLSAMGQMSAALAHELNQPLTAVMNYVKAAQRMLEPQDRTPHKITVAMEAMEKAAGQTMRAALIIQHMREFVEKRESIRKTEDINEIVRQALTLGFAGSADGSVTVKLNLAAEPLPAQIDGVQIQQVLLNLIRNGVEAMAGSPDSVMTLSTEREGDFVIIIVRDTGPGLAPEILAKLFHPFVTTKDKGMGIGLSICQSIVEAHAGTIETLAGGGGAAFRIRLPLLAPPDEAP